MSARNSRNSGPNDSRLMKMQARQAAKVANYQIHSSLEQDRDAQGMFRLGDDLPYYLRGKFGYDTAGGMGPAGYALLVGSILVLAGVGTYAHLVVKDKDKTVSEKDAKIAKLTAQQADEQNYTEKDRKLLDATGSDVLNKIPNKHVFNEDKYKSTGNSTPSFEMSPERSVHAEIKGNGGGFEDDMTSVKFLREVMPDVVPDKRTNFGVYPELKENDTRMIYKLDKAMRDELKKDLMIDVKGADTFVFGYDETNLTPIAFFANEVNGTAVPVPLVFDTEKVLNYLPDADKDVNKAMHDMMDTLYQNAAIKAVKNSDVLLRGYLNQLGFGDDTNLSDAQNVIKGWGEINNQTKGILDKYENGSYEDKTIGALVDDLDRNTQNLTDFLKHYGFFNPDDKNDTLEKGISRVTTWIENLKTESGNFTTLLGRLNATEMPEALDKIDDLKMFNDSYHQLLRDYGAPDNETLLRNMIRMLNETNATYQSLLTRINGSDDKDHDIVDDKTLNDYINDLRNNITNLRTRVYEIGAPFTVTNITNDCDGTAELKLMFKQADRAGLPVYMLNLTDETQKAAAIKTFTEAKVKEWTDRNAKEVYVIDALDEGEYAATYSLVDMDGTWMETKGIFKGTWQSGKDSLKPFEVNEY